MDEDTFIFTYKDKSGDLVEVSDDSDLLIAYNVAQDFNPAQLILTLQLKS